MSDEQVSGIYWMPYPPGLQLPDVGDMKIVDGNCYYVIRIDRVRHGVYLMPTLTPRGLEGFL